jgi:hypothetical protein
LLLQITPLQVCRTHVRHQLDSLEIRHEKNPQAHTAPTALPNKNTIAKTMPAILGGVVFSPDTTKAPQNRRFAGAKFTGTVLVGSFIRPSVTLAGFGMAPLVPCATDKISSIAQKTFLERKNFWPRRKIHQPRN